MSRPANLPGEAQARQAAQEIMDAAREIGRRPSVLAVAQRLGLSNTTFRRNFPEIAQELGALRRTPAPEVQGSSDAEQYVNLRSDNARLRRENKNLHDNLELAAASIMRLTLENRQLREELEAAANVARIKPANVREGNQGL